MEPILELKGVTKKIRGKTIIKGIDFSVKKGQVYGFLGPNGAGKTMTLRMIVGLIKPTTGQITINGYNVTRSFVQAMAQVGCIIENPELYEYMSGYNNLRLLSRMEPFSGSFQIVEGLNMLFSTTVLLGWALGSLAIGFAVFTRKDVLA